MSFTSGCIAGFILCLLAAAVDQAPKSNAALAQTPSRFGTVDLFVDSAKQQLGAWQMEFKATAGQIEIVGIERGDNPNFHDPPYYDPAALKSNRIVVGAFNISNQLPVGKTRVARLHLHISGTQNPIYAVNLVVAGDRDGKPITAVASFSEGVVK
ncbi:MAG TPA: hypothetical protein VGP94_07365 [Tepidisphaeraceae bacterium]|jgi:hypothetical protein|nr:hypothetical protein [Tepidisphaeraceae bacterium]